MDSAYTVLLHFSLLTVFFHCTALLLCAAFIFFTKTHRTLPLLLILPPHFLRTPLSRLRMNSIVHALYSLFTLITFSCTHLPHAPPLLSAHHTHTATSLHTHSLSSNTHAPCLRPVTLPSHTVPLVAHTHSHTVLPLLLPSLSDFTLVSLSLFCHFTPACCGAVHVCTATSLRFVFTTPMGGCTPLLSLSACSALFLPGGGTFSSPGTATFSLSASHLLFSSPLSLSHTHTCTHHTHLVQPLHHLSLLLAFFLGFLPLYTTLPHLTHTGGSPLPALTRTFYLLPRFLFLHTSFSTRTLYLRITNITPSCTAYLSCLALTQDAFSPLSHIFSLSFLHLLCAPFSLLSLFSAPLHTSDAVPHSHISHFAHRLTYHARASLLSMPLLGTTTASPFSRTLLFSAEVLHISLGSFFSLSLLSRFASMSPYIISLPSFDSFHWFAYLSLIYFPTRACA